MPSQANTRWGLILSLIGIAVFLFVVDATGNTPGLLRRWRLRIGSRWTRFRPKTAAAIEQLTNKHLKASFPVLRDLLSIPSNARFPDHVEANVAWMEQL